MRKHPLPAFFSKADASFSHFLSIPALFYCLTGCCHGARILDRKKKKKKKKEGGGEEEALRGLRDWMEWKGGKLSSMFPDLGAG